MNREFPKFASHKLATCFNCEGDLTGDHWSKSGFAEGRGQCVQSCEKCQISTWYDLRDAA